jgi:hypothetical protein
MSSVIIGAIMALVGILGAYLSSRAIDIGMATYGIGLVVFAIFFGFWLIKDHFDQAQNR